MADPRFRFIEVKVGLFVLFAITTMVVVIIALGVSRGIFTKKIAIEIYTSTGEEVSKGMPMKYSGFQISRIDNIQLQDDGNVVMTTAVPVKYAKWIRKDSEFRLGAHNIIGSGYISIHTNLEIPSPLVEKGDKFTLVRDEGLQAIIEKAMPVIEDLKEIVSNVNIILARAADKDGDFNRLMGGLGDLGSDISQQKGSLSFIVRSNYIKDEIEKFMTNLNSFSDTAIRFADNAERGSVNFDEALKNIADKSDPILNSTLTTIDDIKAVVDAIKPIVANLEQVSISLEKTAKNTADGTENLDELRAEIQSIVETGNELLLKIENTWPLRQKEAPRVVPLK